MNRKAELIKAHFYTPFGVPCEHPLPLPLGEVAERSEDGEGILGRKALSVTYGDSSPKGRAKSVKKLPKRPCFCYNRRNGGVFMEGWRKDARHEPIIVDLEALVPKEHLLRKIEKVMDYEWLYL